MVPGKERVQEKMNIQEEIPAFKKSLLNSSTGKNLILYFIVSALVVLLLEAFDVVREFLGMKVRVGT